MTRCTGCNNLTGVVSKPSIANWIEMLRNAPILMLKLLYYGLLHRVNIYNVQCECGEASMWATRQKYNV